MTLATTLERRRRLLLDDGGIIAKQQIQRDVNWLFRTNFVEWTGLRKG